MKYVVSNTCRLHVIFTIQCSTSSFVTMVKAFALARHDLGSFSEEVISNLRSPLLKTILEEVGLYNFTLEGSDVNV